MINLNFQSYEEMVEFSRKLLGNSNAPRSTINEKVSKGIGEGAKAPTTAKEAQETVPETKAPPVTAPKAPSAPTAPVAQEAAQTAETATPEAPKQDATEMPTDSPESLMEWLSEKSFEEVIQLIEENDISISETFKAKPSLIKMIRVRVVNHFFPTD